MEVYPIHTDIITPKQTIFQVLDQYIQTFEEKSILAITSKVISICENRIVSKATVSSKKNLIMQEADYYLESEQEYLLTIKDNILIPSAGIDESNGDDHYILYPISAFTSAAQIWAYLGDKFGVKECGVIITDSRTEPLRRGVVGVCLAWCGFRPLHSYVGAPDIFGRKMNVSMANHVDALAAAGVFMMGEGGEKVPMVVIKNTPQVVFLDGPPDQAEKDMLSIPMEEDIYAPLLRSVSWKIKNSSAR